MTEARGCCDLMSATDEIVCGDDIVLFSSAKRTSFFTAGGPRIDDVRKRSALAALSFSLISFCRSSTRRRRCTTSSSDNVGGDGLTGVSTSIFLGFAVSS